MKTLSILDGFDEIKIYYDCGLSPVTNLLHDVFTAHTATPIRFAQKVRPERYRLSQIADLVCTLKLIEMKLECGFGMTASEKAFFGCRRSFRHNVLRQIKPKEI